METLAQLCENNLPKINSYYTGGDKLEVQVYVWLESLYFKKNYNCTMIKLQAFYNNNA